MIVDAIACTFVRRSKAPLSAQSALGTNTPSNSSIARIGMTRLQVERLRRRHQQLEFNGRREFCNTMEDQSSEIGPEIHCAQTEASFAEGMFAQVASIEVAGDFAQVASADRPKRPKDMLRSSAPTDDCQSHERFRVVQLQRQTRRRNLQRCAWLVPDRRAAYNGPPFCVQQLLIDTLERRMPVPFTSSFNVCRPFGLRDGALRLQVCGNYRSRLHVSARDGPYASPLTNSTKIWTRSHRDNVAARWSC